MRRLVAGAAATCAAAAVVWWWSPAPVEPPPPPTPTAAAATVAAVAAPAPRAVVGAAGAPAPSRLDGAPPAVRALVDRFALAGPVAEYEQLPRDALQRRTADLRARRQGLEVETERLSDEHAAALEAGDRDRVVELRRAISDTVNERSRLAAELLVASYLLGLTDPGT